MSDRPKSHFLQYNEIAAVIRIGLEFSEHLLKYQQNLSSEGVINEVELGSNVMSRSKVIESENCNNHFCKLFIT